MNEADLIVMADQVVTCQGPPGPRCGDAMNNVGVIEQGAVAIVGDRIAEVGTLEEIRSRWAGDYLRFPNTSVVPGLVDAHSHPLFGGSRVNEFILRARGATYQEIHAAGGGIASTVEASRQASDEQLLERTRRVYERMAAHGTTTVEAKSGYGLSVAEELRHLRIMREAAESLRIDVVTTCLGAHALPPEFADDRQGFIKMVNEEMLPEVKRQQLATYADVFCEEGAFTREESRQVLEAAKSLGFGLRIHAEEFNYLGGARMAAELGAASADHLQMLREDDFDTLAQQGTVPIMIPGTSFFLDLDVYAPARSLIDAGLPVGLGTDFNAGSCMTESMPMSMSLAVLKMKMTPEEALTAATINAAHSLGLSDQIGSIEKGKKADLLILDSSDWRNMIYHFGVQFVRVVVKDGLAINTILQSPMGAPI